MSERYVQSAFRHQRETKEENQQSLVSAPQHIQCPNPSLAPLDNHPAQDTPAIMFLQDTIEYFLLGLALAMDCFSVSITCGIIHRRMGAQVWGMALLF